MSQTVITTVFEQWKAQQAVSGEAVTLDEFVFANVPDLDTDAPIDRAETLPDAAQIVHRQAVSRTGVVNENAVVYSVVLGADTGDFEFNWIGLINADSGTLAMIVHAPLQQKIKTTAGQQGNVLTRSFLMEFNGAQSETAINTPAETWQIDFTARMAGMDERQRLENIDIYGAGAFFDNGWLVSKTGAQYFVTKGVGYVAGLRADLAADQNITVTKKPVKVWLDVCWRGTLTSAWSVESKITVTDTLTDYEQSGVKHYVFALASIDENGVITDLRPQGTLAEQQASSDYMRKDKNLADVKDAAAARKNIDVYSKGEAVPATRKINGKDLSRDITISAADTKAIPNGGDLGSTNINTLTGTKFGRYTQGLSSNATTANGYPPQAANTAGALDVIQNNANSFEGCTQEYRPYNINKVYRRLYDASNKTWSGWGEDITTAGGKINGDLVVGISKNLTIKNANNSTLDMSVRLWGNGSERATVLEFGDTSGYHLYTQRRNNNTVEMYTAGKIYPGDWGNFDARYYTQTAANSHFYSRSESDGRYPTGFRIGARTTYNGSDFGSKVPQGAVNINNYTNGDNRINGVTYAYPQYLINGKWLNFA